MGDSSPDLERDVVNVLADATALVRDGRGSEAIRLLTETNRVHRHPEIEEHLVAVRHQAFPPVSERSGPAFEEITPQPTTPALAPTDARELDAATLRRGLAQHGCVLVRGLIRPERAGMLARGIDGALDAFDTCMAASAPKAASPWYVPFTPRAGNYRVGGRRRWVRASGALWAADSPRMLFELLEVVHETGVGSLVEAYLGERPALSANKCTLRRVPVDTRTDWHQDGAFLGRHVRTLNLWLGTFSLRHRRTRAGNRAPTPRRRARHRHGRRDLRLVRVAGRGCEGSRRGGRHPTGVCAGDALLFDHLFLHRTGVAPGMSRERWAIETWFFAPSNYPDGQIPIAY